MFIMLTIQDNKINKCSYPSYNGKNESLKANIKYCRETDIPFHVYFKDELIESNSDDLMFNENKMNMDDKKR